ncbi:hypothetical protein J4727_02060 [Providencia rettgeri]|uniref:Uncharacterized protein n=1 Tax=Providencia rettgeri TaxID=587 RepID=A0A939SQG0_PRORE|nr:hypothetical protein [Providencia rettgeri]
MSQAYAVLGLDRTRVIFNEADGGTSIVVETKIPPLLFSADMDRKPKR